MQPHDTTTLKTCTQCGEGKPATTEYFHACKETKDGLRGKCKDCIKNCQRAYYEAHKENSKAYYVANRQRLIAQSLEWYLAHKDQATERFRSWYDANKERKAEHQRKWYAENRAQRLERKRQWNAANRGYGRAANRRRRARKLAAEGSHTQADVATQYKAQKGRCYYCSTKLSNDYHVDHVIPLSRGGSDATENLVCACPSCNLSKNNKLPHEWPQGGRLL